MMIRREAVAFTTASLLAFMGGCSALDVSDPTALEEADLDNADGAALLRRAALQRLYSAVTDGALAGGMLTDEFFSDPDPFLAQVGQVSLDEMLDRRDSDRVEDLLLTQGGGVYLTWQDARQQATIAIPKLSKFLREPVRSAYLGQMFLVRGFAALRLAEDFCPGFPLHDIVDFEPAFGPPLSTEQAFDNALADLDSALAYVADSVGMLDLASLGRARALLGIGRFTEAAEHVSNVPTDFVYNAEYDAGSLENLLNFGRFGDLSRSVANEEGGVGLDFVEAGDPRVVNILLGTGRDGVTPIHVAAKYSDVSAPIVMASGVEARLIEAEAALHANDPSWLTILNDLRASQVSPPIASLVDPGTTAGRVDLLFRERAFWLFGTGHRLGDLRRLIRHYGRASETVFPTATYRGGGVYETAVSIPFPAALETPHNPAVTGCISR